MRPEIVTGPRLASNSWGRLLLPGNRKWGEGVSVCSKVISSVALSVWKRKKAQLLARQWNSVKLGPSVWASFLKEDEVVVQSLSRI